MKCAKRGLNRGIYVSSLYELKIEIHILHSYVTGFLTPTTVYNAQTLVVNHNLSVLLVREPAHRPSEVPI
jgi:hypothetical protein